MSIYTHVQYVRILYTIKQKYTLRLQAPTYFPFSNKTRFVLISFDIFRHTMANKFEVDFRGNWLKCQGVGIEASTGRVIPRADKVKKCHKFSIKLEGTSTFTPTSVQLVAGKVMKIPWLYGPATRLDSKTIIYPCTRYRCSVPCPCLLCRGKYVSCSVPYTQPCSCADCTSHFQDHAYFHAVYHFGCKSCFQLIQKFPCLSFNVFHNIEELKWPEENGSVVDKFPLNPTYHMSDKKKNSDFLFSGGWKRATDNWKNGVDDGGFWCKYCNTLLWSYEELKCHIKIRHINAASKIFRHHYQNITRETPGEFKCDQCSASFLSSTSLRRHIGTVHYEEAYDCVKCDMVFTRLDNLTRHQKFDVGCLEDKDNYFSCDICDYEYHYNDGGNDPLFGRKDSLLRHIRRVHNVSGDLVGAGDQEPFMCEFCNQEFSTRYNLTRHKKKSHVVSSKDEIVGCELCDSKFLRKEDLAQHVSIHSDCKFTCKDCGKQFSRIDNLTRHKAAHQSDSKFECKRCNSNFTAMTNLQRHQQGFYNSDGFAKNKCSYCEKEVCTSKLLRKHMTQCQLLLDMGGQFW